MSDRNLLFLKMMYTEKASVCQVCKPALGTSYCGDLMVTKCWMFANRKNGGIIIKLTKNHKNLAVFGRNCPIGPESDFQDY